MTNLGDLPINAPVPADALATATADKLGLSQTGTVRRGRQDIPTEETYFGPTYGVLPAPDQVTNLVLPTGGLIVVAFQAMWKNSTSSNGRAAIFLGSNQLKIAQNSGAPVVQEAGGPAASNLYTPLATCPAGLDSFFGGIGANYTGDVATGQAIYAQQALGGVCHIFADAGTYTVSIQYKSAAGTVTVKNRKLWVWTFAC